MSVVKRVLFVCVENSNRSQMAEAFARILSGGAVEAYSAGSRPSGIVNPKAIEAMGELEYDLSAHGSKSLDELPEPGQTAQRRPQYFGTEGSIRSDHAPIPPATLFTFLNP